jgi:menaquinone reductase, molybdopterin-binding-like subunit
MPMDRRDFIKLTAITGTSAALARCGSPENQIIRFIPDDDFVPGVAVWKPSICPLCSAGCGVIVRVMDGDVEVVRNGQAGVMRMALAKKLEGNPDDPISQGKLCARGQAAIQLTYHPDRISHPLKRTGARGGGSFEEVSWDDAIAELVSRLDALSASGKQAALAFLMRPRASRRNELVTEFLARYGARAPITFEMFSDDVLRRANRVSFGREQLPTFDLANSRYVVSFGADFLGTWNSPVAQTIAYGRMRQGRPGVRGKFVQFEPRLSQTGANADEWMPLRPGTEGVVALGLAHAITASGARRRDASALASYTPEYVEQRSGVRASVLTRIARELAEHGPAVAIIGGAPLAHTNGLSQALAVNTLNSVLGSVGQPGGIGFTPQTPIANSARRPFAELLAGDRTPELLLIDDVNPVYASPAAWHVAEALQKIPFIASFGSFLDETSAFADLILPDHSFLESHVDRAAESGALAATAATAPPVMRPLHQTRAMPDVLVDVSSRLSRAISPPLQRYEERLQSSATAPAASRTPAAPAAAAVAATATTPADAQFDGDSGEYPFYWLPYPSVGLLDGSIAHLPWLQELPDPLTSAMWSSWVDINPQTAERLHIGQGDVVEIASGHGTLRAAAFLSPGIAPDVLAMPAGQGHQTFTRYASGRGANPMTIVAPLVEKETGALAWAATRVKITRVSGPDGRLTLFAGATRERPFEGR